jgi:hypothetical protein
VGLDHGDLSYYSSNKLELPVQETMRDDGAKLLEAMLAKRGYLLSYHRMLGASDPQLLANYDALYTRLTLDQRVLTPVERETAWVALIATTAREVRLLPFRSRRRRRHGQRGDRRCGGDRGGL